MSEIDVGKLTRAAENGHGCALKAELQNIPFEDGLRVLNQIEAQNKKDQAADSSIQPLTLSNFGTKFDAVVGMYRNNGVFTWNEILTTELQITDDRKPAGKRTMNCKDY